MEQTQKERLMGMIRAGAALTEEPLARHTTFCTGGPAELYLRPAPEEVAEILAYCRKESIPYIFIGNGSNLLVSDRGLRGVVMEFGNNCSKVTIRDTEVQAEAGALLSAVGRNALEAGLAGFEFAAGIPGSVGGAVVMNAGAYGGEVKDILKWAKVLCRDSKIRTLTPEELQLSYRHSIIPQEEMLVLEACFALTRGDKEQILANMEDLKSRRREKQPLEFPSAGSTFKRPEGYFAGKLIEDAGLRGYRVGGAQVSEKHCGFVVNTDHATSTDIYTLIRDVQRIVKEDSGVELDPEVRILGEF